MEITARALPGGARRAKLTPPPKRLEHALLPSVVVQTLATYLAKGFC